MDELSAKILSMVLLGVVSLILGMIPIPIVRKLRWGPEGDGMSSTARAILSGLLCFGGGVLMATAFLHLLPEVHEGFEAWHNAELLETTLPLGEICVCVGFFMVYFVEEVVHYFSDKHAHHQTDVSVHRAVSVRACSISREGPAPPCDTTAKEECPEDTICKLDCLDKEFCKDVVTAETGQHHQLPSAAGSEETLIVHVDDDCCGDLASRKVQYAKKSHVEKYGTFDDHKHDEHADHDHQSHGVRKPSVNGKHRKHSGQLGRASHKSGAPDFDTLHGLAHHGHSHSPRHHHHGLSAGKHKVGAALRGLLVIIALSLHEVFEGMAVGLQDETAHVLQMFAAVASHKFVISLCVGLELCSSGVKLLTHTIYILVFSLVTPLGIGIGIALISITHPEHGEEGLSPIVVLVLQGLACGTLLYVAFFEILERERSKSTSGIVLLALLLLGFLVMLGLEALGGHDHGHDHGDEVVTTMASINITTAP